MKSALIRLFVLFVASACNNRSASDEIMEKFESVDNTLKRINERVQQSSDTIYEKLYKRLDESKLQQLKYQVNDCKEYLADLKRRFIIFCGDSTGQLLPEESLDNFNLSNSFFVKEGNGKKLQAQLISMQLLFLKHTQDPGLQERIKQLGAVPPGDKKKGFAEMYFEMTPPVAAMTIISKFENDIKTIESAILQEYLSK